MKITVKQLKQLVRESLKEMGRGHRSHYDPETGMDPEDEPDYRDETDPEGEYAGRSKYRTATPKEMRNAELEESLRKTVKAAVFESLKSTKR